MAKKSSIEKNNRRTKMAKQYATKRAELKAMAVDNKLSSEPASAMAGAVRRWDVASWKELEPLAGKEGKPPRNLVYSPDGKAVAAQDTSE